MKKKLCAAINSKGKKCIVSAEAGGKYCWRHSGVKTKLLRRGASQKHKKR